MEDAFVAAQKGEVVLGSSAIDRLLRGVDLLSRLASAESPAEMQDEVKLFVTGAATQDETPAAPVVAGPVAESSAPTAKVEDDSRSLRVAAESLDQ